MPVASPDLIDVRDLLRTYTIEQLNQTAEEYFHQFHAPEAAAKLLAKPFICPMESPELLISFAHTMQGLQLSPGLTVLDFGAGSCWSSRFLTQLGYRVIATDVSETALAIGRRGFELFPVQGPHHAPRFLHFDGYRFDLPDASVDRIMCLSAFHHVPNQDTILREMARVLKPGGIAGFSEPGPNHSKSQQSQHEMRHFTVIENDIHLEEIWPLAQKAGFSDMEVAYWTPALNLMTLPEYTAYVDQGAPLPPACDHGVRLPLKERRLYFLYRYETGVRTSRQREGLAASIDVQLPDTPIRAGAPIEITVRLKNTGKATWLRSNSQRGPVNLGIRRCTGWMHREKQDLARFPLPAPTTYGHLPGAELTMCVAVPPLSAGWHTLEVDLVSEMVAWFVDCGNRPARVRLQVR